MQRSDGPSARLYYGWVVVAVTVVALLLAAGARSAPGVFLLPMERDLGFSRAELSFSASLGLLVFGLAAPLSGRLMDRSGPRRVATAGLVLVALSFYLSTLAQSLLALHLSWGLLSGLGTGLVGSVLGATVANRWFVRRRGLVVGLFGAATSAGQLLFIPLLTGWAQSLGWSGGTRLIGLGALVIAPLVWALLRDHPSQLGLLPDGPGQAGTPVPVNRAPDPHVMRRALRHRDFWLLSLTFFVCGATSNGIIGTHFIAFCSDLGLTAGFAAGMLALMGAFNFIGTLASGYFTDRVDPRLLLGAFYAFRGLSLVILPFLPPGLAFTAFAVLFGLDYIATVPPTTALAADIFGRENVGTVYGWVFCAHQVGAALASWLGGVSRDALGSYSAAFIAAAVLAVAAAVLVLGVTPSARRVAAAR
ncbi:MFS transporter [Deinococcus deserti]|uniref:Putative major facilitator superfamily putative membrane protein n=1 Tax=Deinococcus deserti (strain DSM 17065 / CIP 109153 / LMG 22923 / VCD115) TaxID=546414 RepID=C1D387_DEIDV|nr:MFS transporter [Deinococcus deserti]ACO47876.1 putative major facilitator superfamily; putative membrane protein [Deinococcus deserti VCD115]